MVYSDKPSAQTVVIEMALAARIKLFELYGGRTTSVKVHMS